MIRSAPKRDDVRQTAIIWAMQRGVDTPEIRGKYAGSVVADVVLSDGRDLATVLIEAGYAPYEGGRRREWC